MGHYGGLSGRAHIGAIIVAIFAVVLSVVILSGPVVVEVWAEDATTDTTSTLAAAKKVAKKKDDGLLFRGSDPIGLAVPKEITAEYGISGGLSPGKSETGEAKDYIDSYAQRQLARAEARARGYALDFTTSQFEAAGKRYLGERFRVFSSLLWTEENRFRGSLTVVAPLRESGRGVTFLQPGVIFWNGKSVSGKRDARTDYSLGLVHRVRASGGGYFGGSVFLDSGRYSHQRLGLGLDYQIHQTRLSVNYYLPLTDAETGFSGFRERALRGYDFTLEQGYGQRFVLTATGGIWESTGTDVSSGSSKSLFKTDAKYLVNDIVSLRGGYEWADDNTNVTDGYNVGVDVQLPGGGNGFSGGFEADLWAPVKREARILVSRDEGGAAAKRELASGATRELLSLVGADGRDVRGVGITRPVDGVTGAESIRVTLGPGATVYYAVDWEVGLSAAADGGGVAREGGDSAADDYFAHSVVGVGVDLDNVDGSGNCITVEQSAENSVFNINLRIHGNSSASGKLIHISLKPVVNAAACSAAGGSTQGLSTIEVSASGLIDIRIPLSAGQNGSYARYVSLRALDGSGALVTSSSVLTLDGTNDPQSFRVYVSDAAGAAVSTPLPTGVTFEVVLDFESDTESLGDTYSVARDGSDLAAVADERYLLTFSGETVSHDFGVSLGDPKRQLAEVGVRLEGVATSGSSVVAGFGVSGGAALDELTLRLAPTAVVAADDIVTVVYFSESATLLAENGTLAIELNRDPAPASAAALAVGYEVIAGSASSGDDYTVADGSLSVSFAGVATTANITIPLVDDSDEELSETLTVRLIDSTDNSYVLGGVSEHLVTIVDDDVRLLWFGADSVSVTEAGTSSDITLTLTLSSAAPTGGLEVPLLVGHRGDSATLGLANAGGDYSVSGTTAPTGGGQRHMVDIAAGSTTAVVLVSLHNDTLVEGSETFTLRLAPVAAGGGYALDASRSDVLFVTILDGDLSADETSSATFELVAAGDANIGEGSTPPDLSAGAEPFNRVKLGLAGAGLTLERTLTFAVTLSADNTGGRLSVPESVTILAGSGSAEIPLTITDDQIINGAAKTFTLTVSPAAALGQRPLVTADGAGNARVATENYEIADDDRALLVVEGVPARVLEGVSPLPTFTLTTDREFGAVAGTAAQVSLTVTGLGGASATGDAGNSVSLAVRPVGGSALATLTGDSAGSDQSATFTLPAITAEGTKPSLEVVITAPDELFGGGEQEIGLVFSLVSLVAPASYVLGTNTNEDLYQARDVSASFIFVDGDASLDITSPSSLRFTEGVATSVGIELNQALGAAVPFVVKVLSGGSPLAGFVDVPGTIAAGGTTARVSVTVPGDGTLGKSGRSLTLRVEETGAGVSALVGDDKEVAISVLNGDRADLVVYIEDGTDNTTVMPNEVLAGTNYSRGESGSFSSGLPSGTPLRLALLLVPAGSDARDSGGKVAGLEVFGDVTLPVNAPPSSSTTIADISGVKFYDTNGVAITSYPYDVEFLTFGVGSLPLTYQDNVIGGPGTDDSTGVATGFTIGTLKGGAAGFVRNREFLRSVVIDNAEEDDGGALTGSTVRTLVEVRDASNPLGARAQVQGLYRLEFTGTSGATLGADWSVGLNFAPLVSGGTRHTIRLSDGASGAGSDSTLCAASNARFALSSATGTDGSRGGLVTFDAGASSGVACILVSFDGAASDGGSTSVEVASQKGAILNSADVPDSFISPRITDTGLATSLTIDDADAFSPSFSIETSTGALPSLSGSGDTQTFSEADLPADRAMKLTFAAPTGPIPGLAAGETAAFTPSVVVSGSTSLVSTASLGADAVVYTQPSGGAAATANVTELPFTFLNNDLWAANDYVQEERKFTARLLLGTRPADAQVRGRQITYTITDDEADEADIAFGSTAGVPTAHTAEVAEEAGATTLTVPITIDQSPLTATTFSIEVDTAASTAVAGTDYAVATLPTATFAAKTATLTQNLSIVVTPVDNNDAAPAKTIVIKVSDSAANSLGRHYTRNNTAVITLKDDDTGKITISNTNITVSESAGRVSIPLSYTGSPISGGEVATIATSYANVADSDAGVVSALTVDDYISPPSHSVAFVATASP
ncbi:MAG: inverse autotransporter beta domain-containing protein, partial [Alphaproteobacteria bacterium]